MIDTPFSAILAHAQAEVAQCSELLARHGLTIAFAESATAGFLSFLFSLANRSGDVLKGGVTCYDACVKEDVLNVSPSLIERFTPESEEVSAAIAESLAHMISADIHVGITGLTKPGGSESPEKPVGTMFTAIKAKNWQVSDHSTFSGNEQQIIAAAASNLCQIIHRQLTEHPTP